MYSFGFCYDGGTSGTPGYRQEGVLRSIKEVRKAIQEKLAGKKVTYIETGGKFRAYADDVPTGYIYFKSSKETWAAIDQLSLGSRGEKAVLIAGDLSEVKIKVRKYLEDTLSHRAGGNQVGSVTYLRTGDNISVNYRYKGDTVPHDAEIVLVRVGS